MNDRIYVYILVMAIVTYAIRVLPLTLIRREIKNTWVRSFLFYVPYVTLSVMTFPAILSATRSIWSAAAALVAAAVMAYRGKSLIFVSLTACGVVFLMELVLGIL